MSTVPPPPPNDPQGSGATPADSAGGPPPTGPDYETPGYQPLYDPTTPLPAGGHVDTPSSSGYPQQPDLPQGAYPQQPSQSQAAYPPQPGQSPLPSGYPQQDLLPQDVKPGRSRTPLLIGLVVALALVGGAIATVWLLRDDGESTREAYCSAVEELAPNDDLLGAITSADATTVDRARELPELAPTSVADDWKTVEDLLTTALESSTQPSLMAIAQAYGALQEIVDDSNENCGTAYELLPTP